MKVLFRNTRSPGDLPDLANAYQQQLAALSRVQRATAGAATACKRLELQLGQLAEQASDDHAETHRSDSRLRLEALRGEYATAQEKKQRFIAANQHLQVKIEAFRLAKDATEVAYREAQDALCAAQAEMGGDASGARS
jgi:phage shock protein A